MKRIFLTISICLLASMAQAQHAVVIEDSTYVQTTLNSATWYGKKVVLINDAKGKQQASWSISVDKNRKLKSFVATVCDASGKTLKKFKKGDLQMSELSEGLSDDNRSFFLDYQPATFPVTVTFEWTMENDGAVIAYPMFCPVDAYDVPVRHAVYLIHFDTSNPCRYYAVNCDSLLTLTQKSDYIKAEFHSLPAVSREPYSLPPYQRVPKVCFAPDRFEYLGTSGRMDTWEDFGKWQYGLIKDRMDLPAQVKAKVHELTDACATPREKIARLYRYLYDNTRYVSIQLGIGGYQPSMASEVASRGFGDCKGLSNYMVALLREAGVPAFYAAISTKYSDLYKNFPSMNQMNHVIAGVPMEKDTLWLECTNARYPLGYVHEDIAGHQALIISSEGGKVVRLPRYRDTDNLQRSQFLVQLQANGSAQVKLDMEDTNRQYENLLPVMEADDKRKRQTLLHAVSLPAAQITSLKMNEEKGKPVIHTQLEATSSRYANVTGKRLFVTLNPLKTDFSTLSNADKRTSDLTIDFGFQDMEDVTLVMPDGYQVESLPAPWSLETPYASFASDVSVVGQEIHVKHRLTVHSGTFPAKDYQEWVKVKNQIAQYYQKQAVIVKN